MFGNKRPGGDERQLLRPRVAPSISTYPRYGLKRSAHAGRTPLTFEALFGGFHAFVNSICVVASAASLVRLDIAYSYATRGPQWTFDNRIVGQVLEKEERLLIAAVIALAWSYWRQIALFKGEPFYEVDVPRSVPTITWYLGVLLLECSVCIFPLFDFFFWTKALSVLTHVCFISSVRSDRSTFAALAKSSDGRLGSDAVDFIVDDVIEGRGKTPFWNSRIGVLLGSLLVLPAPFLAEARQRLLVEQYQNEMNPKLDRVPR